MLSSSDRENGEVISVPLVWLLGADDDSLCFCRDHKILEKEKSHESTNERKAMGNAGVCQTDPEGKTRPGGVPAYPLAGS
jgi:hypothetical protein